MTQERYDAGDYPWAKLYELWFTSRSHLHIDGLTKLIPLRWFTIARARGFDANGSAWLTTPAPELRSFSARELARLSDISLRRVNTAIAKFTECGTMGVNTDGAFGFVNFRRWQESPSAVRMRRHRKRNGNGNSDGDVTRRREEERRKEKPKKKKESQLVTLADSDGAGFEVYQAVMRGDIRPEDSEAYYAELIDEAAEGRA
tara:strand:+ start:409 stop:1014 length:606 start_codon:yes stop_codon:yes gene_type:complete